MPTKTPKTKKPKPLSKIPPVPDSIQNLKYAAEYWRRITPHLVDVQTIGELDIEPLEALCRWWHVYREKSDWLDANPDQAVVVSLTGVPRVHPSVTIRQQAYNNMAKLWPKFGLTPKGLADMKSVNSSPIANPIVEFAASKYRTMDE